MCLQHMKENVVTHGDNRDADQNTPSLCRICFWRRHEKNERPCVLLPQSFLDRTSNYYAFHDRGGRANLDTAIVALSFPGQRRRSAFFLRTKCYSVVGE